LRRGSLTLLMFVLLPNNDPDRFSRSSDLSSYSVWSRSSKDSQRRQQFQVTSGILLVTGTEMYGASLSIPPSTTRRNNMSQSFRSLLRCCALTDPRQQQRRLTT
jgi:hypothetical protein